MKLRWLLKRVLPGVLGVLGIGSLATMGQEPAARSNARGSWHFGLPFVLGQPDATAPTQPAQPAQPTQPAESSPSTAPSIFAQSGGLFGSTSASGGLFGSVGGSSGLSDASSGGGSSSATGMSSAPTVNQAQVTMAQEPSSSVLTGGEAAVRGSADVGDLLSKSLSTVGVIVQRRNPIVGEPHLRAFRQSQILTQSDGGYWFPGRPDLDTIVSKLDSNSVGSIVIMKGPYSVRHGPGFSVIDIESVPTPRYNSSEVHGVSTLNYKTNGGAWFGQQTLMTGDRDWGFRGTWDSYTGNDYYAGNGVPLPTSYNSQNFNLALGMDLNDITHLDFKALRIMQHDLEFPGVLSDISQLVSEGGSARLTIDDNQYFHQAVVETWFNQTAFDGDNLSTGKRKQIPQLDNIPVIINVPVFRPGEGNVPVLVPGQTRPVTVAGSFILRTAGQSSSWGERSHITWGQDDAVQVSIGQDFRYLGQRIDEYDSVIVRGLPNALSGGATGYFPVPRSRVLDPGIFLDGVIPVGDRLKVRFGGRADLYSARIQQPQGDLTALVNVLGENALNERSYATGMGYLTSEYMVTENITANTGIAYAQRPPNLVELFADQTFLGMLQNGFNNMTGNPNLYREQLYQVDFGLKGSWENFRCGIGGYIGLVNDFITFRRKNQDFIFPSYVFANTSFATLTGTECYMELDMLEWLTGFSTYTYLDARDQSLGETLPGTWPMESRTGLRIHDPQRGPRWALEVAARMVGGQYRYAESLGEVATPGFTVFDARAYWMASQNLLLTMGVENFLDRGYREALDMRTGLGVYQPGISFYTGFRWNY